MPISCKGLDGTLLSLRYPQQQSSLVRHRYSRYRAIVSLFGKMIGFVVHLSVARPFSRIHFSFQEDRVFPPTWPLIPKPGMTSKFVTSSNFGFGNRFMRGCSVLLQRLAAPNEGIIQESTVTSVTTGVPFVIVPVCRKPTIFTWLASSNFPLLEGFHFRPLYQSNHDSSWCRKLTHMGRL